MSLKRCVFHQVVWFVLAMVCNFYSLWRISQGQTPLSSTDPTQGIVLFLLFAPLLWLGYQGWLKTYLVINTIFWLLIAYGGVGLHINNVLMRGDFSAYASIWSWCLVVCVNVYGVSVSALASATVIRQFKAA